jgi:hypothetical protein
MAKKRRPTTQQNSRTRTTGSRPALGGRRATTRSRKALEDEQEPKDIMLSFRFDRETAIWLKAAAYWTRTPGAQIVRTSLRKEPGELERRFGRPFPRPPSD